jgi:sugar transferase (PEP-CTERM system associated)
MSFLKNPFASKNVLLIGGDIVIALLSIYAAFYLRFGSVYEIQMEAYSPLLPKAAAFAVFIILMCHFGDLYRIEKEGDRKEIFLKILVAGFIASMALGAFYYFVPSLQIGRGILFIGLIITVLLQSVWHIGYSLLIRLPVVAKKVLILGTGPIAEKMGNILRTNGNGFALSGYVNCMGEPVTVPSDYVIGNGDGLLSIALKERVNKIVVSLSERRGTFPVREVLNCKLNGIDVIDGPSFYEQLTGKMLVENMSPSHLIFSDGFKITVILLFSIPFLMIIPVLIKIDSRGPVFFKQRRVGEGEKEFTLYKYRTMVDGAEKDSGPVWSSDGDSRITILGRFLRKSRLDEIPQLYNVIRGDMSFIGPRPERPFFVESLKKQIPYYSERHCLKPGISGWAQVRYEYGDSIDDAFEKLKFDLYYIKHQSISLDILILINTMKVIMFGRGGR